MQNDDIGFEGESESLDIRTPSFEMKANSEGNGHRGVGLNLKKNSTSASPDVRIDVGSRNAADVSIFRSGSDSRVLSRCLAQKGQPKTQPNATTLMRRRDIERMQQRFPGTRSRCAFALRCRFTL